MRTRFNDCLDIAARALARRPYGVASYLMKLPDLSEPGVSDMLSSLCTWAPYLFADVPDPGVTPSPEVHLTCVDPRFLEELVQRMNRADQERRDRLGRC